MIENKQAPQASAIEIDGIPDTFLKADVVRVIPNQHLIKKASFSAGKGVDRLKLAMSTCVVRLLLQSAA